MANDPSDSKIAQRLLSLISYLKPAGIQFMEVCGTHTVSLSRFGIRALLPKGIRIVSGPGCPVCVTSNSDMSKAFQIAAQERGTLATFGDMMRVPLSGMTLFDLKAKGADVRVVYSPVEALQWAKTQEVVFLGVGFETTSPTVASLLDQARNQMIPNISLLSFFKLIPPALRGLLDSGESKLDGFLLPGHVSTIIGIEPYEFIVKEYGIPCAIAGFEPVDILLGIYALTKMSTTKKPALVNTYARSVRKEGNRRALEMLGKYFQPVGVNWRGLGFIPESGLKLKPEYEDMDAETRFELENIEIPEPSGCKCPDVIKGLILPNECPLFGRTCRPESPIGPCMVSSEGACAAFHNYR